MDDLIREGPLSTDQMAAVLDNAPVAIYVSALESWKLLYANHAAKSLLLREPDGEEITCYQAAGFDKPCPFCKAGRMSRTELFVREYHHPVNRRIYQLSGKIIDWAGKSAHIEYVMDITDKKREEDRSEELKRELQETFTSVPCGLCVYRYENGQIAPIFHNPAFFEIMGYSGEHIQKVERRTTFLGVHPEDLGHLQAAVQNMIERGERLRHIYRVWNDSLEEYRWIRLDGSVKSQADGSTLLYGVYSDVSEQQRLQNELRSAYEKMDYLVNAIPGGIASYRVEENRLIPAFCSDGVMALSGHTRSEYEALSRDNALDLIYEQDRERVETALRGALISGDSLYVSYRMRHKDGSLIWVRLNGRRIGPQSDRARFYAILTGMSPETQLFQSIANESADGIYVFDRIIMSCSMQTNPKACSRRIQAALDRSAMRRCTEKASPVNSVPWRVMSPTGSNMRWPWAVRSGIMPPGFGQRSGMEYRLMSSMSGMSPRRSIPAERRNGWRAISSRSLKICPAGYLSFAANPTAV